MNEYFHALPSDAKLFIDSIKAKWPVESIYKHLDSLKKMRVLVVGDAIIDQYHYTNALGQTGKGNVLAVEFESSEQFAGGALAVANHVGNFVDEITLVTGIGSYDSHEAYIREKLLKNINPIFFSFTNAPTVTKRRFVDGDLNKLFEVYYQKDLALSKEREGEICEWLEQNLNDFDAVIVPDFGNGFISQNMANLLSRGSKYLVVNTQINSGNRGFHAIHRYSKANFISLNEPELRFATLNRTDGLPSLCRVVLDETRAEHIAVTRGKAGVLVYEKESESFFEVPALATQVLDRIGAGDAFLSLAGICAGNRLDPRLAAFIGSVAAAIDVQIVCNREPITAVKLKKFIATLLK